MKSKHKEPKEESRPEVEAVNRRQLFSYLKQLGVESLHGVGNVQQICRVGFNQAKHIIKYGLEHGYLVSDKNVPYKHRKTTLRPRS